MEVAQVPAQNSPISNTTRKTYQDSVALIPLVATTMPIRMFAGSRRLGGGGGPIACLVDLLLCL